METLKPRTPDLIDPTEVARWRGADAGDLFRLIQLLALKLPRGSGRFAKWAGARFLRGRRLPVKTGSGVTLAAHWAHLDAYLTMIVREGRGIGAVRRACAQLVEPGGVFYDIGANVGFITAETAKAHPEACIVAFEPQPELAESILLTAALNGFGNVSVVQALVGEERGEAELFVPEHGIHASMKARSATAARVACQMVVIDELVGAGTIPPPSGIKIDVEGAELLALRGAAETIRQNAPWILFEADENLARFGHSRRQLIEFLASLVPYRFCLLDYDGFVAMSDVDDARFSDVLAVPPRMEMPGTFEVHNSKT